MKEHEGEVKAWVQGEVDTQEARVTGEVEAQLKVASGLDKLENKAKDDLKAASGLDEPEAAEKYLDDAVKTVSREASELLWENGEMPDLFQTVFGYVFDVLSETLFLVIFFVQAAGLAQLALDKHGARRGGRVAPAPGGDPSQPVKAVPEEQKIEVTTTPVEVLQVDDLEQ